MDDESDEYMAVTKLESNAIDAFSDSYAEARMRFREAAAKLQWDLEAHPIAATGPSGEALTMEVACSRDGDSGRVLVVSSGLHGVEGFFGSAVQTAMLRQWAGVPPPVKVVFLHALNPYGFAWLRRFDENNVDPNRNFLLDGEPYEGVPAGYAELDHILNPRRAPLRWDLFPLTAVWAIARHGKRTLQQAIATGQYDFPQGLFFGGHGPSTSYRLVTDNFDRWLGGSGQVVHLDFHTGLGGSGDYKLLLDHSIDDFQRTQLIDWFGAESFVEYESSSKVYKTRGGIGHWCVSQPSAKQYQYACVEFGTYGPVQVLGGLRAENQAHHWGKAPKYVWTKHRLKELFCPSAASWRADVLAKSRRIIEQAIDGLVQG